MKKVIAIAIAASLPLCASMAQERKVGQPHDAQRAAELRANPPVSRGAPGGPTVMQNTVIVYDTGTFSGVPNIPAIADNFSFGNRYDTQSGLGLATTVVVNSVAIWPAMLDSASTGTGGAFVTLFGPVSGTNIAPVTSPNVGSMNIGAWNTVAVAGTLTGSPSSFHVGMWNPTAGATAGTSPCGVDCVGVDTNTVNGQGFHGFAAEDLNGGNYQSQSFNALIRPIGTGLPVELTTFEVE